MGSTKVTTCSQSTIDVMLSGGGTMGALIRAFDWSSSPLGPVSQWPSSLRTAVNLCLNSHFPIVIFWGPELRMLYNDAYMRILADKHPASLGQAAENVWPEIWSIVGPMLQQVLATRQATWVEDFLLVTQRHGYPEESYFTFSYSPIADDTGRVGGVFCPVTETTVRKQVEKALREREARLRTLINLAPEMIWEAAPDGTMTTVSEHWINYTGLNAEQLARDWPQLVLHPEDYGRCVKAWHQALAQGTPYEIEARNRRADGVYRWFLTRARPFRDANGTITGWYGTTTDIHAHRETEEALRRARDEMELRVQERTRELIQTNETLRKEIDQRKQTERQLQQSHERLHTILQSITSGFYALDRQWRFTYVNAQAEPLVRKSPDELLGKNVWEEFPEAVESIVYSEYHRAVREQVAVKFAFFYPPFEVWFEVHAYPSPDGLSVYFHDITDRKRTEEKLQQSERLAAIGTTVAKLSHEIGNPLNGMVTTIQLLERTLAQHLSPDPMIMDSVQDLKHETNRLRGLLEEFRAFARPQDFALSATNIAPVIKEIVRRVTPSYLEVGVNVESVLPPDLPLVMINRDKFSQIVLNLCKNAVEAMPQGGTLTVSAKGDEAAVCLDIQDNGQGIPAGVNIFEPFVTTKPEGTGLGLAIVKQLVEAHGGTITYLSSPNQGTTFTVQLPVALMQDAQESGCAMDMAKA
ncbi:MAG: PAS domain S-box protein [Candidatus Binatia bacterium]